MALIARGGYREYHDSGAMGFVTFEVDTPDLAGWLWAAAAGLLLLELGRYVIQGSRPTGRRTRWLVLSVVVLVVVLAVMVFRPAFDSSMPVYACLVTGILSVLWLWRSYQRTNRSLSFPWRWLLPGVRVLVVFVVLMVVIGPVLQWTHVVRERAAIGFALDNSRSMTVRDAVPVGDASRSSFMTRLEAVKASVDRAGASLDRLGESVDIRWFVFDREAKSGGAADLDGEGGSTALAEAVRQVAGALEQTRRKVAGVIAISDGRDNASVLSRPEEVGIDLAALGIPLYAVGVGSDQPVGQVRGLQGRRLDAPSQIAIDNRLPVAAEFLATGLASQQVEVSLLIDDVRVASKRVEPTLPRESVRIEFSPAMSDGGLHRVTVEAKTAAGVTEPAELSQFVRVSQDSISVLYVDRPRYERAAIVRALAAARELRVTRLDVDQLVRKANRGEGGGLGSELGRHRVVLIGDIESGFLTPAIQAELRDAVVGGQCGLVLVGCVRTMGGGLADGPLAEVLPVGGSAVGELPGPVPFELTDAGRVHPVCRLDPDVATSGAAWVRLPPFAGCARLARPAPSAEVLLRSMDDSPLMVVQQSGRGRVGVLAFDSTWQWSFSDPRGRELQQRFWRQLVLWLADRRPNVWASTDRPRYDLARLRPGVDSVQLRAGVIDPDTGQEPAGIRVTGSLKVPGGTVLPVQFVRAKGGFEARLTPDRVGEYHVEVVARAGEQLVDKVQAAFVVALVDQELAEPLADLETLRRMAARTEVVGGQYVPLADLPRLLDRIRASAGQAEFRQSERIRLVGDHPWIWYLALVSLLVVEWTVRRRVGLV
ncbi:MAG: hypothetical protein KA354_10725 [Phycisphaerae bacterium]|nr:hypothetical protein [Phycisphaerae bacterium]